MFREATAAERPSPFAVFRLSPSPSLGCEKQYRLFYELRSGNGDNDYHNTVQWITWLGGR